MLCPLLLICQKFFLKFQIFLLRFASLSRSRQRKCMQHTVFQFHQRLRRSSHHLNIITRKIKHIWRRIGRSQNSVSIQQRAFKIRFQAIGKYHLENVPLFDVMLCLFHHLAVSFFVKQRSEITCESSLLRWLRLSGANQLCHIFQF